MQITRETDYAIRCVLHLAESKEDVVMIGEIAKDRKIPKSFLAKILQKLAKAGIVQSLRGVKGGFQLSKKPENINLLDVIEVIEGPVSMNICAMSKRECSMSGTCSAHPAWVDMRKIVETRLKRWNFSRLTSSR